MTEKPLNDLSERELEILRLVATGASNKEIAQKLFISTNTVKVHLRNIFAKVGAASRTEAAMYVVRVGLAQPEPAADISVQDIQTGITGNNNDSFEQIPSGDSTFLSPEPNIKSKWRVRLFAVTLLTVALLVVLGLTATFGRQVAPTVAETSSLTPTNVQRWQKLASLPTARRSMAVAAFQNQIYTIGGESEIGVTGTVELFDPGHNTWITMASKPIPVKDIKAVMIGGLIFVPGGLLQNGLPSDALEVYDPRLDRWETRSPLPTVLSAYALAAFEGRVFLFGGWDGQEFLNTVFEYDPSRDIWIERTPMLTARGSASAAVAGGKIFVLGGVDGSGPLTANEVYTPDLDNGSDNPWDLGRPLPQSRIGMNAVSIADYIYIIGGKDEAGDLVPSLQYIPDQNIWFSFDPPVSLPWSDLGLVTLDSRLFALGGEMSGRVIDQNLSYQAIFTVVFPVILP